MTRLGRMRRRNVLAYFNLWVVCALVLSACGSAADDLLPTLEPVMPTRPPATPTAAATVEPTVAVESAPYLNPDLPVEARVEDLLSRMTLAEKVGQMTQVENYSILIPDIAKLSIGSILTGGGPIDDITPEGWAKLTDGFQTKALQNRLGIPLIFGVDAVHGHNHVKGAVFFPQNIGLGATRDADLVERIGRATAEELAATGMWWNFAPVIAVPQDVRWGRTYEGYSENTEVVTELGTAYIRGLQGDDLSDPLSVLATPKHFIGDGATVWGSSTTSDYMIDQGDMVVDEATLREKFLPPYQAAIDAGAQSIMVSFSSWNGKKMHGNRFLLTDLLKGELGFDGFLISDWQAIDQLPGDNYSDVITSINAGMDMIMVPYDYIDFIGNLTRAVNEGKVPMSRIDDAVGRILKVKFEMGLFEHPYSDPANLALVGNAEHRALAREAVRKSAVLLKNADNTLPIAKDTSLIYVAGLAANDIGLQSGGWTITWQGKPGALTTGTTILDGVMAAVESTSRVEYNRFGDFSAVVDEQGAPLVADVGIVVIAEKPYAEGVGDRADLRIPDSDVTLIEHVKQQSKKVVVILLSGRPLVVSEHLPQWDAFVAAFLPGSEGAGVADLLFGDYDFTGKLSYSWPRSNEQLPFDFDELPTEGCDAPLYPYGFGLSVKDESPELLECPIEP